MVGPAGYGAVGAVGEVEVCGEVVLQEGGGGVLRGGGAGVGG